MRRLPRLRTLLMIDGVLPCALTAVLLDGALILGIGMPQPAVGGLIAMGIVAVAWLSWRRLIARTASRMHDAASALDAIATGSLGLETGAPDTRESAALFEAARRVALAMRAIALRESENRAEADIETLSTLQEAQAARRSKSYFLAAVDDRFRQPLQAMQWFAAQLTPGADISQHRVLDPLRKCVDDMAKLLEELLDLSRLDAGVVFVHPQPITVAQWLSDTLNPLRARALKYDTVLVTHAGSQAMHTDPVLATQLLRRLVDNAIDQDTVDRVLVAARMRDGTLRIEVRDNGPGIALIHQRRIFDEFVQLPGVNRHDGFGLGLTIAQRLAGILRTRIQLHSSPGAGSTFSFELVDLSLDEARDPHAARPTTPPPRVAD